MIYLGRGHFVEKLHGRERERALSRESRASKDDRRQRGGRPLAIPVFPVFRMSRGEAGRAPNRTTSLAAVRNDDNAP